MNDPLRLFFALPCPADQAQAICRWRDEQGLGGRAVPPANLHLTLAFLGAQPADALAEIARLGESIRAEAFELRLDRLISLGKGFICLAPGQPPRALADLVALLRAGLAERGLPVDDRPFLPHLTLVRQAGERRHGTSPAFAWPVERFVLYISEQAASGVRYRELCSWPLLRTPAPLAG
ncbi:RNA 2',3'-cyclic phosphodiesterase [Pseudomonas oligotrophica]|uniref:RNA 2',3'-cyclic phosphodiesterase n=1 Tax=Pseudomonas oligotrophica TaxID=2912055 RepID=UPI001F023C7F|nr:RNA 2',3'-cyclic phosphodiesterase [Pseudomonas oligotrophica]MCF7203917.1 RNA 2',3'-cyclic phosphodiesterase [Pseudomonas oligotrophica]